MHKPYEFYLLGGLQLKCFPKYSMCFKIFFFWEKVTNDYAAPVIVFPGRFECYLLAALGTSRSPCGTAAGNPYLASQKITYNQVGTLPGVSLAPVDLNVAIYSGRWHRHLATILLVQTSNRNDPASGKFRRIVSQQPAADFGQGQSTDQGRNRFRRLPSSSTHLFLKNLDFKWHRQRAPPLPSN